MKMYYRLTYRLIAYALLLSLFLQSCGGSLNQFTPQEKRLTSRTPELSDNSLINTDKKIITSGGYLASFYEENGELKADLKADKMQKEPNYKGVSMVIEEGTDLIALTKLDSTTQQSRIQLSRKNGKINRVIILNGGVAGGMFNKDKKTATTPTSSSEDDEIEDETSSSEDDKDVVGVGSDEDEEEGDDDLEGELEEEDNHGSFSDKKVGEKEKKTPDNAALRAFRRNWTTYLNKEAKGIKGKKGEDDDSDNQAEKSSSNSTNSSSDDSEIDEGLKKLKKALDSEGVTELENLEKKGKLEKLFQWTYGELNVFEYACQYSNISVIFWIVNQIVNLNDEKINKLISEKTWLEPIKKKSKNCGFMVTPAFKIKERFENSGKSDAVKSILGKTAVSVLQELGVKPIQLESKSKEERDKIMDWMKVERIPNNTRGGYYSVYQNIKNRPPRVFTTFAGERERQLLKHFSTMLLLQLKRKAADIYANQSEEVIQFTEIETMHVEYDGKDFLFVAGNEAPMTKLFKEHFKNIESLRKALTEKFELSSSTANKKKKKSKGKKKKGKIQVIEGNKRVERYSSYFRTLFSKDEETEEYKEIVGSELDKKYCNDDGIDIDKDIEYYKAVLKLLRDKNCKILHHSLEYENENDNNGLQITKENKNGILGEVKEGNKIIFVNTSDLTPDNKFKFRHAEEFLTDIAEVIKNAANENRHEAYTCIAGTKRPCLTCYSRMRFSEQIDTYGERPGLLFVGRFKQQNSINKELAENTITEAIIQNCYVTMGINSKGKEEEVPTYDSGTDEEDDKEDKKKREKGKEKVRVKNEEENSEKEKKTARKKTNNNSSGDDPDFYHLVRS